MKIQIQPANLCLGQIVTATHKTKPHAEQFRDREIATITTGDEITIWIKKDQYNRTGLPESEYIFEVEITHPQLVAALAKPGADILASLTPQKCHLWHMASALLGECMELIEAADELPENVENMKEEIGDAAFYLEGYRAAVEWELDFTVVLEVIEPRDSLLTFLVTSGEFFDQTKKHILYGKPLDVEKTKLAMIRCYIALQVCCDHLGITWEDALNANIAKLSKRYASVTGGIGYSDKAAQERADKHPLMEQALGRAQCTPFVEESIPATAHGTTP